MGVRTKLVITTLNRIIQDPRRLKAYCTRGALKRLRYLVGAPKHGDWEQSEDGWSARRYESYAEYIEHQRSKLGVFEISAYNSELRALVRERCADLELHGKTVLCLAARLGGEVQGFLDLGSFAVGVDLNPGPANPYVLPGDFHDLVFADNSVDAVFTNSLDHSLQLYKLLSEVARLLKPGGKMVVEANAGDETFDEWAVVAWKTVEHLVAQIEEGGFHLDQRSDVSRPWMGEHLRFSLATDSQQLCSYPFPDTDNRSFSSHRR